MENRVTTQDVTIGEQTFRLAKMDARTGSWLFSFLAGKASPDGDKVKPMQLVSQFHKCTKDEFDLIQTEALKRVYTVEQDGGNVFPVAILGANGAWANKALENDPVTVFNLMVQTIMFNVMPFFTESESSPPPPKI